MACSSSSLLAALAAAATVLLLSATAAHGRQHRSYGHISIAYCEKATHTELCAQTFKSGKVETALDLEEAAVKLAIGHVKDAISAVDRALKAADDGDKARKTSLEGCKKYYKEAREDLKNALDYLKGIEGDDGDLNMILSSAVTNVESCTMEWDLTELQGFPIKPESVEMMLMSLRNSISLGNSLQFAQ